MCCIKRGDRIVEEARRAADEVIAESAEEGHDYSSKREDIARLFEDQLWKGNWDSSTTFEDGTKDLRLIQEDEYDQHMDDDTRPETVTCAAGHYVIIE